jgi:hypothetical protein
MSLLSSSEMHEKKDDQGLKNRGPEDKKNLRRPQMNKRHTNRRAQQGSVATLELRRSLAIASAKLDRHRAEQTKNEAME